VTVVGLDARRHADHEGGEVKSLVARWDAEWNPHLFTFLELEHQEVQDFGASLVDRLRHLVGRRRPDRARDRRRPTSGSATASAPSPAPAASIPRSPTVRATAGCRWCPTGFATAGVSWVAPGADHLHPERDVIGERLGEVDGDELGAVPITNFSIEWQPWDKRLDFSLDAINLFDQDFDLAERFPPLAAP
jgi:hypothetical protein